MIFRTINGQKQVCFECPYDPTLGQDRWVPVDMLEGMYGLLLCQLRGGRGVPSCQQSHINIKRRRALIYIRRALRMVANKRLPLDLVKQHRVKGKHAKFGVYTIMG